jgi:hypothetical protein
MQKLIWVLPLLILGCIACDKKAKDDIYYKQLNKEYIVKTNVQDLQQSNDAISKRIDSVLNGLIADTIVGTGFLGLDLTNDDGIDIGFEIIDLVSLNGGHLPDSLDSLAVRVLPMGAEIIDNSTYGYCDALTTNEVISSYNNWYAKNSFVLGTFAGAGQFNGKGERYLAFRIIHTQFVDSNSYRYGWIKLYVSEHNDTLRVMEYALNRTEDREILAGQTQ